MALGITVTVEETIIIHKPVAEVFKALLDYDTFILWNPWSMFDSNMEVIMHEPRIGVGSGYSWKSNIVGTGTLTTVAVTNNERIDQSLEFYKPMKSKAHTYFITKAIDNNNTEVRWILNTKMPFFALFFINQFKRAMHADFELGLIRFASLIDKTAPKYIFDIGSPTHKDKLHIVTLPFSGSLSTFKTQAGELFTKLAKECSKHDIPFTAMGNAVTNAKFTNTNELYFDCNVFAIIHANDVDTATQKCSKEYKIEKLEAGNTLCAIYHGSYDMLDTQYHILFSNARMRKHKLDKKRNYQSVEIYLNNPSEVSPDELKTEIFIPIV